MIFATRVFGITVTFLILEFFDPSNAIVNLGYFPVITPTYILHNAIGISSKISINPQIFFISIQAGALD